MTRKATTLIEILLYFAIFAVVSLAALTFAIQIFYLNTVSSGYNELTHNISFITNRLTSSIQNSGGIDLPDSIFDNDQGALSLNMDQPGLSKVRFHFNDGDLLFTRGTNPSEQLNSESVTLDYLRFHRVVYQKAPDQVVIDAQFTSQNSISANKINLSLHLVTSLRR